MTFLYSLYVKFLSYSLLFSCIPILSVSLKDSFRKDITNWFGFLLIHCLIFQNVVIDQVLEPGIRVTVAMGTNRNLDAGDYLISFPPFFFGFLSLSHRYNHSV